MPAASLNLEPALAYRSMGLAVLPLEPGEKAPLILRDGNGLPIIGQGGKPKRWSTRMHDRPLAEREIRSVFESNPSANIGIIAGAMSNNLIEIDEDDPILFRELVEPHIAHLLPETWVVGSPRRKGRHIYIQGPYPVRSKKLTALGCDVKANGDYCAAPNSVFAGYGQYEFWNRPGKILKLDSWDPLAVLGLEPANNESEQRPYGVPAWIWNTIHHGRWAEYGYAAGGGRGLDSRSEAEYKAALYLLHNAAWTREEVIEFFFLYAHPSSRYRELGQAGFGYLDRTIKAASEWVANNAGDVARAIASSEALALRIDRKAAGLKHSDLAIFRSMAAIARRADSIEFGASVRELSELSGVRSYEAVISATKRIEQAGLIQRQARGGPFKGASRWALVSNPEQSFTGGGFIDCLGNETIEKARISHRKGVDLWRSRGLGRTGEEIFRLIEAKPGIRSSEIVDACSCSRPTVFRKLKAMADLEMIREQRGGWHPLPFEWGEAAFKVGTYGKRDETRKRHSGERKAFMASKKKLKVLDGKLVNLETGEIVGKENES